MEMLQQYWWVILLVVLALIVIWAISTYNSLVGLRNTVEESFSTVDVYLQKRYDLIPNLVETVKGYASHESETLERVIAARNQGMSAKSTEDKIAANQQLTSALDRLMVVVEQYPDLKADQGFRDLQAQLSSMEGEIANYRKYYNATVKNFNNKIEQIPSNIIAGLGNFKRAELFEVTDESVRVNPRVEF
ncbi:MAG: LemA family protein [Erysipelothrix sp.]|nr:LemA family protein [Erysipelothrix sp.]